MTDDSETGTARLVGSVIYEGDAGWSEVEEAYVQDDVLKLDTKPVTAESVPAAIREQALETHEGGTTFILPEEQNAE